MTTKGIVLLSIVALLMLCFGLQAGAATSIQGYVIDPNWYARHPQATGLYGVGQYEYGVGGNASGSSLSTGFANGTDIYGKFYQTNMPDGKYVLASWDTWWRQQLIFGCDFTGYFAPPQNIRLHANMWSYSPTWDDASYSEHGQVFRASGTSVTLLNIPAAGETNRNYTVTFHEGGPGGPQVGPTSSVSGTGNMRLKWSGGRIPTVPGQLYYVKISASGANLCNNEPIPDYSDPMPEGCLYQNGQPDARRDLGLTICSDDDGILTDLYVSKQEGVPGTFSSIGQTFTARGTSLLSYAAWIDDANAYVARLYTAVNGTQIGPAKQAKVMRMGSGDPEIIWTWAPNECPLTPGQTYYMEIKRADNGFFYSHFASRWDEYSGGEAYRNRVPAVTGSNPWDLSGTIMEEESPGSATIPAIQFYASPGVARPDRGTNSLTIRWTTDIASDSAVDYAAWNCPYTDSYYSSALTTSHVVTLTGLKPNTMYHIRTKSSASSYKPAVSRDFVACTNASANLLVNGDFENGSGGSPQRVIPGWTVVASDSLDYGVSNGTWFAGGDMVPYNGGWFLEFAYNMGKETEGKVYQTANVTPGKEYALTAAVSDFMMESGAMGTKFKYDVWNQSGRLPWIRLGIDPYGSHNPNSGSIKWTPKMYSHLHYTTLGTKVTALGSSVTVFVQIGGKGGAWQLFGVDNVQLSEPIDYQPYELKNLKSQANGTGAQVSELVITATPADAGAYYAQTPDRSQGIRIESTETADVGTKVTVKGTLQSLPSGERYLANSSFSNAVASTEPMPVMMLSSAVGGAALGTMPAVPGSKGPHNTALVIKVAGTVTVKAEDSSYIFISDGSLAGDGIKVDTSYVPISTVPNVGDVVGISGISSIYSDGSVKPLIIPRWIDDISSAFNP